MNECAFTIAFGKKTYKKMAVNLARSIEYNSPETSFTLISDEPLDVSDLKKTTIKVIDPSEYGKGFSVKLKLDKLAPSDASLFIDADCLVYHPLEKLFDLLKGRPIGVFGVSKVEGEMFGDVRSVCQRMHVPSLPHFNGGLYYIEKGSCSDAIYARARELEPLYDDIGLVRLRGQPNDELLMSISLAEHGILPVFNSGEYYSDFQWWPIVERLNVIRSLSSMRNPEPGHPLHQSNFPASNANAAVVHFLGHHVESALYSQEVMALRLASKIPSADVVARIFFLPRRGVDSFKDLMRPIFRRIFGTRRIKPSSTRLIVDLAPHERP